MAKSLKLHLWIHVTSRRAPVSPLLDRETDGVGGTQARPAVCGRQRRNGSKIRELSRNKTSDAQQLRV